MFSDKMEGAIAPFALVLAGVYILQKSRKTEKEE